MQKLINFEELPEPIQLEVVKTLFFYDSCHIEGRGDHMEVCTSYCLKSSYARDEWISQEIKRDNDSFYHCAKIGARLRAHWEYSADLWDRFSKEEKDAFRISHNALVREEARSVLKWILWDMDCRKNEATMECAEHWED